MSDNPSDLSDANDRNDPAQSGGTDGPWESAELRGGEQGLQLQLEEFLAYPREDLEVEMKGWLDLTSEEDKANLAQAILALANHGGGYVLIGLSETTDGWEGNQARPSDLGSYSQDAVNGIVYRYADPPFHCDVVLTNAPDGASYPIVVVPGGHRTPIRAKRDGPNGHHVRQNAYYIRRPGPHSEAAQTAREWDDLIARCIRNSRDEYVNDIRELLRGIEGLSLVTTPSPSTRQTFLAWISGCRDRWDELVASRDADGVRSRYQHGVWTGAYQVDGEVRELSLGQLQELLATLETYRSGWPFWNVFSRPELVPHAFEDELECWLVETRFKDASHSDYWRASPVGRFYHLRGYQEDSVEDRPPGSFLDLTIPVWRVGEILLHGASMAQALAGEHANVFFRFEWEGLNGRVLDAWASRGRDVRERHAQRPSATADLEVKAEQVRPALPELVHRATRPLYESFELSSPPLEMVQDELAKMLGRS